MIEDLLEGKPFGHPLHPLLVHLPIGLFLLSLLLDLGTMFLGGGNVLVRGSFYTLLFGEIMAIVAAVPGLVDRAEIRDGHPAKRIATTHMVLNLTVVALFALSLVLRYASLDVASTLIAPFLLSLVGVGIIFYSGYLGGLMVYGEGIAVGRHRRHTDTPEETIEVSAVEPSQTGAPAGSVRVAQADRLDEGETLRVAVDGTVMTIARVDGEYFAFQEFCTHRFGPLSEGHFHEHEVMCPWHGSCFDMRSGKVTQGPAKVDLRTFDVGVAEGWIWVKV